MRLNKMAGLENAQKIRQSFTTAISSQSVKFQIVNGVQQTGSYYYFGYGSYSAPCRTRVKAGDKVFRIINASGVTLPANTFDGLDHPEIPNGKTFVATYKTSPAAQNISTDTCRYVKAEMLNGVQQTGAYVYYGFGSNYIEGPCRARVKTTDKVIRIINDIGVTIPAFDGQPEIPNGKTFLATYKTPPVRQNLSIDTCIFTKTEIVNGVKETGSYYYFGIGSNNTTPPCRTKVKAGDKVVRYINASGATFPAGKFLPEIPNGKTFVATYKTSIITQTVNINTC